MNAHNGAFVPLVGRPLLVRHCSSCKSWPRRTRLSKMTLRPQDSKSWKEERDKRALESEFKETSSSTVDADISQLHERIALLSRREKQWKEIRRQFDALSFLTGIPMLSEETGDPNYLAWTFMALSISVPAYLLYCVSQSLFAASNSFTHLF